MTDVTPEVRTCDKCGVADDEPHHVQYVAYGSGAGVSKHVRCCAGEGCPICTADVHWAEQAGVDPNHLREFLQARPPELQQSLFDEFGVESPDLQIAVEET
jgi:hypothetical protein